MITDQLIIDLWKGLGRRGDLTSIQSSVKRDNQDAQEATAKDFEGPFGPGLPNVCDPWAEWVNKLADKLREGCCILEIWLVLNYLLGVNIRPLVDNLLMNQWRWSPDEENVRQDQQSR